MFVGLVFLTSNHMFVSGDFRDKSRKVLKLQNFQKCTRAIYPKSPFQACNYYYKLSKYGDYKNKMHSYNFPVLGLVSIFLKSWDLGNSKEFPRKYVKQSEIAAPSQTFCL